MPVKTYECFFLLDPNKSSADWDKVMGEANGIIERHGGEILFSRPWGEPKLAYEIQRFKKGAYLLTYFNAEPGKIPEIEHDCSLSEFVLRQMVLKLHPSMVDQILEDVRRGGKADDESAAPVEFSESEARR